MFLITCYHLLSPVITCYHLLSPVVWQALGEHVKAQEQKQEEQERRMAQEAQEVQRWKATVAQLEEQVAQQSAQQSAEQSAKHHAEAELLEEQTKVHQQHQERLRSDQEQLARDQRELRQSKETWEKRNAEARYATCTCCPFMPLVVPSCPFPSCHSFCTTVLCNHLGSPTHVYLFFVVWLSLF